VKMTGGYSRHPRQMAADCSAEGPGKQPDDGKEREAAGDAVGEFDERVEAGRMLDYAAVAQRPVVCRIRRRSRWRGPEFPKRMTAMK